MTSFDLTGFPKCGACGLTLLTDDAQTRGCPTCGSREQRFAPAKQRITNLPSRPLTGSSVDTDTGAAAPSPNSPAAAPVPPLATYELEQCDECGCAFSVEVLTPVMNVGLVCESCVDEIRMRGMAS
jgi:predicted RNA-binding Zn-ribbon protein involved in translation (DUF1610 family)